MTDKNLIKYLLYFVFILTPIFGLVELIEVVPALRFVLGCLPPLIYIKISKDVILLAIFMIFGMNILYTGKIVINRYLVLIAYILIVSFLITFLYGYAYIAIIGLRVFSPILLFFVSMRYLTMEDFVVILKILLYVVIVEFLVVLVQMMFGSAIYGVNYLGFAARPFGTFVKPATLAIFILFVIALKLGFDIFQYKILTRNTAIFIVFAAFFILMTASGSGLLGFSMILFIYFIYFARVNRYLKMSVLPLIILSPILIFYNLVFLTGRLDIYKSVLGRMSIFTSFLDRSSIKDILIGRGLGFGSDAAVSFMSLGGTSISGDSAVSISDSLYVSIFSQTGLIFLLIFIGFLFYIFITALKNKYSGPNPIAILLVPFILVVSFAGSFIEIFPVNWVSFIVFGLVLKEKKRTRSLSVRSANDR